MLKKITGYFIAGQLKADKELYRKAIFTSAACLLIVAVSLLGLIYSILFIDSLLYILVGAVFTVLLLCALLIFRKNGSFTFIANFLGTVGFLAVAAAPLETGGIYSPDLLTLLAIPVSVLMIGSRRIALFWSIMILLAFTTFYILEETGIMQMRSHTTNISPFYYWQDIITISVMVLFLVFRNEKLRLDLLTELKHTNKEVSEKNKEITDSINYAKRIQQSILPPEEEVAKHLKDCFILYQPKDIVSGDFYWSINTTTSNTGTALNIIAAADCTGHGIPGAFMSMLGYTLLNQTIKNPGINSPADVLDFLNSELPKNLKSYGQEATIRDGMDIALCAIDSSANKLYFAAANNPAWVIRNNELIELKPNKQAITAGTDIAKKPFTTTSFDLQKNDCIYIFTDGYADQFGGPKGKKFKYKQLEQLLIANTTKTMKEQKQFLQQAFDNWKGELEQVDDVLIVGIRV